MTDELPPRPEPYLIAEMTALLFGPNAREPLYTRDQMQDYARAAVLAERERCAKVCEDRAKFWDANVPEGDEHVYAYRQEEAAWCADAIRAEMTKRPDPKTGA